MTFYTILSEARFTREGLIKNLKEVSRYFSTMSQRYH